jgi:flagellar hook-length control protein FliK
MNVTAPVPQFRPSSDAAQFKPTDSMDSGSNSVGGQDFSSTLHEADNKPARKSVASKSSQDSQGGSQSPAGGNTPPSTLPPAPTPPVQNAPTAAPPTGTSGAAAPVASNATASGTAPAGPALPPTGTGSQNANSPAALAAGDAAAPLPQTAVQAAGLPPPVLPANESAATDSTGPDGAGQSAGAVNVASTPPATAAAAEAAAAAAAASSSAAAAAQKSAAAIAAASPTVNPVSAQLAAASQAKAAAPLQGNQPTHTVRDSAADLAASTASTSSSSNATAAADTAAQTAVATAAAVAAARAGNASDSDDPASQDQSATPDTGPKAAVAAAPAMPAPVAAALAGAHAVAATAATTAVPDARAIMNLANVNAGVTDKASHDNNPDTSLTAASTDGSVGAAQLMSSAPTTDTPAPTTFKITPPVETADFSQGVADRVSFMVDGNISSAKLQVNPPALGPIEVRIALQGSHAQVSFTSHSALTRDALESGAPKLREMLGSQGFGQVSVDVSQGSYQDRSAQSSPYQGSTVGARDSSIDAVQSAPRSSARIATGVLDAYA